MRTFRWRFALGAVVLLVVLGIAATSCSYRGMRSACVTPQPCRFRGIEGAMADVSRVDVLVVHGIGSPSEGYSDRMVAKIAHALSLTQVGATSRVVLDHHGKPDEAGILRETTFENAAKRTLVVHEVTWAPVINKIKRDMLAYDATSDAAPLRSVVNRALKRDLMNHRLADAVLYLGAQQAEIQYPVKYTICKMLGGTIVGTRCTEQGDEGKWPLRVVLITQSLGSRATFDTLMDMRQELDVGAREPIDAFAQRTGEVYMLANQLPLLELADVAPPATPAESGRSAKGMAGFLRMRTAVEERGLTRLTIVALNDPNDLLSYDIAPDFARRFPQVTFVNVDIGVSGPGLFRIVANPLRAHVGHENDQRVIDMISRGRSGTQ